MVYSNYKKQRILYYYSQGLKAPTITKLLRQEHLSCSRACVHKFLNKFKETGNLQRSSGSGQPSKITAEIKSIIEEQMQEDDETTVHQLHCLLRDSGYTISLKTVLRCRRSLAWTFWGSAYCQLIHQANKEKRLNWACEHIGDCFQDVIFTDESTV